MKLWEYEGKRVRLTDIDGDVFEGRLTDYIDPEDNEPEGTESVIIFDQTRGHSIEFDATDIKSIEIIP